MRKVTPSEFDAHLQKMLAKNPKLAEDYIKQFAELALPTQLAIIRRRKWLTQKAVAKALRVEQPHVARMERASHDPRLSSIVSQARVLQCHLMVVPDELLDQVAQLVAANDARYSPSGKFTNNPG